ncbi:hypothetical protein RB595_004238 [Gaeumannomyces hyphopodioides]
MAPLGPLTRRFLLHRGGAATRRVVAANCPVSRTRAFATASPDAYATPPPPPPPKSDNRVKIVEVGPRDGLQNEKTTISLATKIDLIERLSRTGLTTIEAGSFVAPKWVPQMNNSSEVLEHILKHPIPSPVPVSYSFLTPNTKGLSNAFAVLRQHPNAFTTEPPPPAAAAASPNPSPDTPRTTAPSKPTVELAVFAAATESFSRRNLNADIATTLDAFREVIQGAKEAGLRVRAYISVVLGCPFEGYDVDPHRVASVARDLLEMGADEIALGDTTGMGTAPRTLELLRCVAAAGVRNEDLAMHFHDTYGQALVNTAVALEHGVRTFDSAVGGLGGCPYSPGATGNVATEDMVYFLETLGMDTGVDLDAAADIGAWITKELGKPHDSSVGKAVIGARSRTNGQD